MENRKMKELMKNKLFIIGSILLVLTFIGMGVVAAISLFWLLIAVVFLGTGITIGFVFRKIKLINKK